MAQVQIRQNERNRAVSQVLITAWHVPDPSSIPGISHTAANLQGVRPEQSQASPEHHQVGVSPSSPHQKPRHP